jgi:hypothetical protein
MKRSIARSTMAYLLTASLLAAPLTAAIAASRPSQTLPMPHFRAENDWLKLPNGWILGDVSAVTLDKAGHVWVLHRPRTLAPADRARAAPPVLEFLADGTYLKGFGGDGAGYDWPLNEHSIAVDGRGHVWITGNSLAPGKADDALLEFDGDGHFLRQMGGRGTSKGDADVTSLDAAADLFVDDAAHEIYIADGYGNRRIIVFDSETGRFKRMWSAFGAPPPADPAPKPRTPGAPFSPETGEGPQGFNTVHAVEISHDGLVYVADRSNQRVQVFTKAGRYLRQAFVDRNEASPATASSIAFSPDAKQRYLYVADLGNSKLVVFDRARLVPIGSIGSKGDAPGQFITPHLIASGRDGTIYVADPLGRRLTRLIPDDK